MSKDYMRYLAVQVINECKIVRRNIDNELLMLISSSLPTVCSVESSKSIVMLRRGEVGSTYVESR